MVADSFSVDSSDLSKLSADLRGVPHATGPALRSAMEVTGRNIRDTARENASGLAHAPLFPRSITYDFVGNSHGGGALGAFVGGGGAHDLVMEVGPEDDKPQGPLGILLEYGSINNPPRGIMHGALQAHEEDFERGIEKAIDDALRSAGL